MVGARQGAENRRQLYRSADVIATNVNGAVPQPPNSTFATKKRTRDITVDEGYESGRSMPAIQIDLLENRARASHGSRIGFGVGHPDLQLILPGVEMLRHIEYIRSPRPRSHGFPIDPRIGTYTHFSAIQKNAF